MINTKNIKMSPTERKALISELRKEHQQYFDNNDIMTALYVPKMAYRPTGKDDLHVSFFPS